MTGLQPQSDRSNRRQELVAILVLSLIGFLVAAASVTVFLVAGHRVQFLISIVTGLAVGVVGLVKFARRRGRAA